ncbi:MAG: DHHW family protein [Oscillospiraceae bacterium]
MKINLKDIKKFPVLIFFALLLFSLSIADLFSPVQTYSETENRKLETFPKFSWTVLKENEYTPKVEDFTEDHFIVRDKWISLKSISESLLGKKENNNIVYGADGYMFTKFSSVDEAQTLKNITSLNKFFQRHSDRNITLLLAPTAPGILKDKVSDKSPVFHNDYILDKVFDGIGTEHSLDVRNALVAYKDEYIYYRTDHHWTTYGAYYAYCEYMNHIGRTPKSLSEYEMVDVEGFLGTHYSKAKSYNVKSDTLSYIKSEGQITIDGVTDSIYDLSKLETRDKYSMFLRSNNGFSTIKGNGEGKIMIIKDSFANCFIPFLIDDFAQIDIFDMRYITMGMDKFIADNDYEQILFLYNSETFAADKDLIKINLFNTDKAL